MAEVVKEKLVSTRALREILRHLRSPQGGGKCIVVSTLIMQEVERLCDSVVVMKGGEIVEAGPVETVMDNPTAAYTRELLSAAPQAPSRKLVA